ENDAASAHGALSRALQSLRSLAALDGKLAPVLPMLEEAAIQVREAAREQRLGAMEELGRKHRLAPAELPEHAVKLRAEQEALERADMDLAVLRRDLAAALSSYRAQAEELSGKRGTAARALARDISARMQTLGMSGGRFETDVTQ